MEPTQVGPFQIVKRLGTNRRQKVYQAIQTEQGREVALKFIKFPPEIEWETALAKINRETEILKQLEHENLVKVYGAGVHEDQVFFASELIEGESLTTVLSRRGKLAPDLAVEYGRQIALMLEYIHRQDVIHSKLTPDKLIVTSDHKVKVLDLRLNRTRRRRWDASRRRELEIAAYMAPEQFTEGSSNKSDFYALGVIMFEMLAGRLPYPPDTVGRMTRNKMDAPVPSVATHVMNCPIWLDKIVTQLLDPNPRKRPHSARAIVLAFEEIKKIDRNRKAAVAQVSGSFNPLNAGADKSEANRLLGKKKPKKDDGVPFYQKIPFLIGGLVLIAVIMGIAIMPPNPQKLLAKGKVLMESNSPNDWRSARDYFKQVIARADSEELRAEAEEQYYESRRRALVIQAESGKFIFTQSQNLQEFGRAVKLQQKGENAAAQQIYRNLVAFVDPQGIERHVYLESKRRLDLLAPPLPTEPDELFAAIDEAASAVAEPQLKAASRLMARIIFKFADDDSMADIVAEAEYVQEMVSLRLEKLRNADGEEAVDQSGGENSDSIDSSDQDSNQDSARDSDAGESGDRLDGSNG